MSTRASGNALFGWGDKDFVSPATWHAALVTSGLAGLPTFIRKILSDPGTAQSKAKILATAIGLPDNKLPKHFTVKYFHEALVVYGTAHLNDEAYVAEGANAGGDEGGDAAKASAAAAAATAAGDDHEGEAGGHDGGLEGGWEGGGEGVWEGGGEGGEDEAAMGFLRRCMQPCTVWE
jgi:hypothetical protein